MAILMPGSMGDGYVHEEAANGRRRRGSAPLRALSWQPMPGPAGPRIPSRLDEALIGSAASFGV